MPPLLLLFQKCRQESATDLEKMKADVEELKEKIEAADQSIKEISATALQLEREKNAVCRKG